MTRAQGLSRIRFLQVLLASILVGVVSIGLTGTTAAATNANDEDLKDTARNREAARVALARVGVD